MTISILDDNNKVSKTYNSVKDMMDEYYREQATRPLWKKIIDFTYYRIIYWNWDAWLNPKVFYRQCKWFFQRLIRGFDDTDMWCLDYTIAKFVLPRLKYYRKLNRPGFPILITNENDIGLDKDGGYSDEGMKIKMDEWNSYLDKMILAFETILNDNWLPDTYKEDQKIIEEGMLLFAKYFQGLWD